MIRRSGNLNQIKRRLGLALTFVVAMAWLIQSTHLQLPIEIVKNISVPFPCQFSGCGCSDAVQCWSSCGCHSDAEKIAWAKANSVKPPQWYLKDLQSKSAKASETESTCGGCCCCGSKPTSTDDTAPQTASTASSTVELEDETSTRIVYLNLKQRRKCQGQYGVDQVAMYFISPANRPLPAIFLSPMCVREPGLPPAVMQLPDTPPPQFV